VGGPGGREQGEGEEDMGRGGRGDTMASCVKRREDPVTVSEDEGRWKMVMEDVIDDGACSWTGSGW